MDRFRDHGNGYQDPHRNSQYPNSSSWPSNDQRPNFAGDHHHRDHHHNYHHYNHHFQPQFNHQQPQHQHHHPQQQHHHHHQRHQFESFPDHQQAQHIGSEQNDLFWSSGGGGGGYNSGQKRSFHYSGPGASPDHPDGSGVAKLYVAPVPRTSTEDDIRSLFKEHGNVVEVILPKDKKTGERQGYCFVKYLTFEEAGRAIKELDGQHTFPGELASIRVRYADADRDRIGTPHQEKIFVSGLSKQASRKEIEEIFSPYGMVEDIYIIRDDHGENRGCGFVQFSRREMALAAIKALHGVTMRGCDLPLIVKFAYPKKPRAGEPRANFAPNSLNSGCHTPDLTMRPVPNFCNPMAGPVPPTVPYPVQQIPMNPQPQAFPPWANTGGAAPIVAQQSHPPLQAPLQSTQFPLQQTQAPWESSQSHQQSGSGVQKQIPPVPAASQNFGQPQSSNVSKLEASQSASSQTIATSSSSPTVPQNLEALATLECDWSEHTCPDGYKYYYNCVTLESTWDKPEEFALFEKQLQKQQKPQNPSQKLQSHLPVVSTEQVSQNQEVLDRVLDHVQVNSETGRLVGPTCI